LIFKDNSFDSVIEVVIDVRDEQMPEIKECLRVDKMVMYPTVVFVMIEEMILLMGPVMIGLDRGLVCAAFGRSLPHQSIVRFCDKLAFQKRSFLASQDRVTYLFDESGRRCGKAHPPDPNTNE